MIEFESEFPVTKKFTYLNTASSGLIPDSVVNWRRAHDVQFLNQGSLFRDDHKNHIESIRAAVGDFCGAHSEDIALIPNFTFGFNTLLEGLPKSTKFLLLKNDYPSINWPVEQRKFPAAYAQLDEHLEANIEAAFAQERPEVFAFSMVQYINGIKMDLQFLSQLKAKYPQTLFFADGTQFVGTTLFNFNSSPIDVLAASTYKWLLSGYGNGFILIKSSAKERLYPSTIGFNSAPTFFSEREDAPFNKLFEPGHHDTLNHGSMKQAIQLFNRLGRQELVDRINQVKAYAMQQFSKANLLETAVAVRVDHSTIFNIKGSQELFDYFKSKGIVGSLRGNGIRLSFHFYNTKKDVDYVMECIAQFNQ